MTLLEIVEQLKACGYHCEAGSLEMNVAFQELEEMATATRYDVVIAGNQDVFVERINDRLAAGWRIHGDTTVSSVSFVQAMIRP